jgi:hypothetical protein
LCISTILILWVTRPFLSAWEHMYQEMIFLWSSVTSLLQHTANCTQAFHHSLPHCLLNCLYSLLLPCTRWKMCGPG